MPKRILYVGSFNFPNGDAGARRVLGLGRCLRESGFEVRYFGTEDEGQNQGDISGRTRLYEGFAYESSVIGRRTRRERARRLLCVYLTGLDVISRMKKFLDGSTVAIIAYQAFSPFLFLLRRLCNAHRIALIVDTVEWYERGQIAGSKFGLSRLESELRMRYFQRKADGIITVSRLLERYYRLRDKIVVRVPPLVDLSESCWNDKLAPDGGIEQMRVGFIGSAGNKDLVVNAIRGLRRMGADRRSCRLLIVGPSHKELARNLGPDASLLSELRESLEITGRMPWDRALRCLTSADFSFFLRPDARFAHAGFPTKLVESLAMGVPVITNITGDIGLYVRDMTEGILVRDESPEAFAEGLSRALGLSKEEKNAMRRSARLKAEECFDYRRWIESVGGFMRSVLIKQ